MKYQSLLKFYWFGTCLRYLQDASSGYLIHGSGRILSNIEEFFKYLDALQLIVTSRLAHRKLDDLLNKLRETEDDSKLDSESASELASAISLIRDTLEVEIEGVGAYTPTPKRLNLDHLISNVKDLFSPNTFECLPEISRYDYSEAGKCIAFERSTAGAFHILRGTEGVLRWYYFKMVRRNRISSNLWGPIVGDLRQKTLTKKYDILNNHLDNIRKSFRNPTQHPEATFDIHEVQDLWSVCVDVVNRMVKILQEEDRL